MSGHHGTATDRLIDRLAGAELRPVRASLDARVKAALLALLAFGATTGIVFALARCRPDIASALRRPWFVANLVSLAGVFYFSAYSGLTLAIPGRVAGGPARLALVVSLLAFFASLLPAAAGMPFRECLRQGLDPAGFQCCLALGRLAALPGALMLVMARRLAPVAPRPTAALIGLAIGAAGAFGLNFECSLDQAAHLVAFHGLPILGIALAAWLAGRRLLKW